MKLLKFVKIMKIFFAENIFREKGIVKKKLFF